MKNFRLNALLEAMLEISDRVSDLNFTVAKAPQVEIDGDLKPVRLSNLERLTPFQTEMMAMHLLGNDADKVRTLVKTGSVDASYSIPGKTRFRVNIFSQRGTFSIVMRVIPAGVPTMADLGLPDELLKVGELKNGIVLVTGPTGYGK